MFKIGTKALINTEDYNDLSIENERLICENQQLRKQVADLRRELAENRSFDAKSLHGYTILYDFHERMLRAAYETHKEIKELYQREKIPGTSSD